MSFSRKGSRMMMMITRGKRMMRKAKTMNRMKMMWLIEKVVRMKTKEKQSTRGVSSRGVMSLMVNTWSKGK